MIAGRYGVVVGHKGTREIARVTLHQDLAFVASESEIEDLDVARTRLRDVPAEIFKVSRERLDGDDLAKRADLGECQRRHSDICANVKNASVSAAEELKQSHRVRLELVSHVAEIVVFPLHGETLPGNFDGFCLGRRF